MIDCTLEKNKYQMYYGSGTVQRIASGQTVDAANAGQTLHVHSPDGSTSDLLFLMP